MRTIIVVILFILGTVYFFQNDFDIKTCEYIDDPKLLVCLDKRFRAAQGFYRDTTPKMIVLRSFDTETIDHECLHYVLYQFAGQDVSNSQIQHKIIHLHQLCNQKIKSLI